MKLRLDLRLSQKLIMTPQLQQAIKLLQLSRLELQQSLTQHLMENPLLEDLPTEAEDSEATSAEEKAEDAAASANSEPSNVEESTPEERDTPDEASAAGWEEYFGSDRRIGGSESQASSQDELWRRAVVSHPPLVSWPPGQFSTREASAQRGCLLV